MCCSHIFFRYSHIVTSKFLFLNHTKSIYLKLNEMLDFFHMKARKDMLQLMLNAHKDTADKDDIHNMTSYSGNSNKWKDRGNV